MNRAGWLLLGGAACQGVSGSPLPEDTAVDAVVTPADPITGDPLHLKVRTGELDTATVHWTVDGADAGLVGVDVPAHRTHRDERWAAVAGDELAGVTIGDAPPVGGVIAVAPAIAYPGEQDLRCLVVEAPSDAEGDALTAAFTWRRDGVPLPDLDGHQGVRALELVEEGTWSCDVAFDDGHGGRSMVSASVEVHGRIPMAMVPFGPGTFQMGVPVDEVGRSDNLNDIKFSEPLVHQVTLTRGFEIGRYEVTRSQFEAVTGRDPAPDDPPCPTCAAKYISWNAAAQFANTVSGRVGLPACYTCTPGPDGVACVDVGTPYDCAGYRLPTEAEWEYAARSGGTVEAPLPGGQSVDPAFVVHYDGILCQDVVLDDGSPFSAHAWFCSNAAGNVHPVGQFAPTPQGLYDVVGNVREWVDDSLNAPYTTAAVTDPWTAVNDRPVLTKGGSQHDSFRLCRLGTHLSDERYVGDDRYGFRLARTLPAVETP